MTSTHRSPAPGYVGLAESGELRARARRLAARLRVCDLCPRDCGVDRYRSVGFCGVGANACLAVAVPHRGEEPVLTGGAGAGALFFGGCNLRCLFCQNYQISDLVSARREGGGSPYYEVPRCSADGLAAAMLRLQEAGCVNIDVVSGSHVVPPFLDALDRAARRGLHLPLVWNSNAYERVDVLRELEGVVDVYLPDLKYGGDGMALRFSHAPGYVAASHAALREMDRQVGPLRVDADGVARRGLIVRHLVLPRGAAGTGSCLRFVAEHLSRGVAVSLMAQYAPLHRAAGHAILGRRVTAAEYEHAVALLETNGIDCGWCQDPQESPDHYRPDFRNDRPFSGGRVATRDRERVF